MDFYHQRNKSKFHRITFKDLHNLPHDASFFKLYFTSSFQQDKTPDTQDSWSSTKTLNNFLILDLFLFHVFLINLTPCFKSFSFSIFSTTAFLCKFSIAFCSIDSFIHPDSLLASLLKCVFHLSLNNWVI